MVKKLYNQLIFAMFPIASENRLDNCPPALQPLQHPNVEQPSVLKHFNRLFDCEPPPDSPTPYVELSTDWFPDKWIE